MKVENSSEFLSRLGMDGRLWAEEFCKKCPDVPLEVAISWFNNALMAGYDEARERYKEVIYEGPGSPNE